MPRPWFGTGRTFPRQLRILRPGGDHIDTTAWEPLLYVFRDYFGAGRLLGSTHRR